MTYLPDYNKKLEKKLFKLKKKDLEAMNIIQNKIQEVLLDPHRYKPLSNKLSGIFRVHIKKSFVLTFEILETDKIVNFLDYDHHDNIYE